MIRTLIINGQTNYTIKYAMRVLDKAIRMIPSDKLDFKPTENAMTAAELATHPYKLAFIYAAGAKNGKFDKRDLDLIPFDYKKVKNAEEIVEYGNKIKKYVVSTLPEFEEEDMDRKIQLGIFNDLELTVFDSLHTIFTEVIHHRGQLCLYLRMMGIDPPFIYDFS